MLTGRLSYHSIWFQKRLMNERETDELILNVNAVAGMNEKIKIVI
jgi:hypothetical protein